MGQILSKQNPRPGHIIDAIHNNDLNFEFTSEDLTSRLSAVSTTQYNWTYLHLAVWMSKLEIVENLINIGADINSQDSNGDSPLHLALIIKNKKISQVLLEKGAKAEVCNFEGIRPTDLMKNDLAELFYMIKGGRTETEVEEGTGTGLAKGKFFITT